MIKKAEENLKQLYTAYDFGAEILEAVRYGEGHINDTFCLTSKNENGEIKRFIVQRINTIIFTNPNKLMQNIVGVTDYLRNIIADNGGDTERETMTVLRTKKGEIMFTDTDNGAWRVYLFVEQTVCLQKAETPELFYESAKAFGNFQNLLSNYPADTLHETIANFHNTVDRLRIFKSVLSEDIMGRAKDCQAEIDFVLARENDCAVCVNALNNGELPLRVTHNDTKLNNILMDEKTQTGVCVIDLDTVMPGLSVNDFGDSIRFGANHSAEDEMDLTKVNFDIDLYEIYTKGFLEGANGKLTQKELAFLPWGAKLMTLECGMRFLTDYLQGDTYFKTHRDNQNLDRCRTQFKLVNDMEEQWNEMFAVIEKFNK